MLADSDYVDIMKRGKDIGLNPEINDNLIITFSDFITVEYVELENPNDCHLLIDLCANPTRSMDTSRLERLKESLRRDFIYKVSLSKNAEKALMDDKKRKRSVEIRRLFAN